MLSQLFVTLYTPSVRVYTTIYKQTAETTKQKFMSVCLTVNVGDRRGYYHPF